MDTLFCPCVEEVDSLSHLYVLSYLLQLTRRTCSRGWNSIGAEFTAKSLCDQQFLEGNDSMVQRRNSLLQEIQNVREYVCKPGRILFSGQELQDLPLSIRNEQGSILTAQRQPAYFVFSRQVGLQTKEAVCHREPGMLPGRDKRHPRIDAFHFNGQLCFLFDLIQQGLKILFLRGVRTADEETVHI